MPDIAEEPEKVQSSVELLKDQDPDIAVLKTEGNALFSSGDYVGAIKLYSKGLNSCPEKSTEAATFLKNRAAAYLKLEKYQKVIDDTTAGNYMRIIFYYYYCNFVYYLTILVSLLKS